MNKIGWCSETWNPCWGCLNHCEYCYARKIARRFGKEMAENECHYRYKNDIGVNPYTKRAFIKCTEKLRKFIPTFLHSQFNKKFPKKPQRIFVGSMSEIYYWKDEWIEMVIEKVKQYPQHTFIFLTKFPRVYNSRVFPRNCWLGLTITHTPKEGENYRWDFNDFVGSDIDNLKFVSFEPLLGDIHPYTYLNFDKEINWMIFGAETGNRKDKIIPKKEWMEDMINHCKYRNIPIYLKDSLKEIYPIEIKEFPKGR